MPRCPGGPARLRYRPGFRGPRLSLFHVKLTDAALQALLVHRRLQGAPRPVIAFRGNQGYLRIPRPPEGRPGPRSRLFTFFLSRCSREKPQASFDCVRQSARRLESEGVIRERLTFCATAEAPACGLSQPRAERQPRESAPAAAAAAAAAAPPHQGKGLSRPADAGAGPTLRAAAATGGEGAASGELRALGPFLARLLALRPPQKAELLGGAEQAGLGLRVLAALKETNAPGPARPGPALPSRLPRRQPLEAELLMPSPGCGCITSGASRLPPGFPVSGVAAGPAEPRAGRESAETSPRSLRLQSGQALRAALEPRATRWRGPGFPGAESSWWGRRLAPQDRSRPSPGSPAGEEAEGDQQQEALPAQGLLSAGAGERCCPGPQETPDYSLNYGPISSTQQCQAYREAFSADYAEYLPLHTRIASVSSRFAQLGARIQALQQGSEHYKVLEHQILQEYQQFKQVYPNYQQEKQHCEYLHKKLSHIKEQILSFEHNLSAAEGGR